MTSFGAIHVAGITLLLTLSASPSSHAQLQREPLKCYVCGGNAVLNFKSDSNARKFQIENQLSDDSKKHDFLLRAPCKGQKGALVDCTDFFPLPLPDPDANQGRSSSVTLFKEENLEGDSREVNFEPGKCTNLGDFDDQASSINRPQGFSSCVRLWELERCRGHAVTFFGSQFSLKSVDFDKKASSLSDCFFQSLACAEVRTNSGDIGRECALIGGAGEKSMNFSGGSKIQYCYSDSCNSFPADAQAPSNRNNKVNSARSFRASGWEISVVIGFVLAFLF